MSDSMPLSLLLNISMLLLAATFWANSALFSGF